MTDLSIPGHGKWGYAFRDCKTHRVIHSKTGFLTMTSAEFHAAQYHRINNVMCKTVYLHLFRAGCAKPPLDYVNTQRSLEAFA